jgi:hypothetical protein
MIKVENDMLVLDNTFSKEDVQAIDEFVKINVDRERKRIIKLLQAEIERVSNPMLVDREYLDGLETAIDLIKNFGE